MYIDIYIICFYFFFFLFLFFRFRFLFFQKLIWLYFKKFSFNSLSLSSLFFQIDKTKVKSEIEREIRNKINKGYLRPMQKCVSKFISFIFFSKIIKFTWAATEEYLGNFGLGSGQTKSIKRWARTRANKRKYSFLMLFRYDFQKKAKKKLN